MSINKKDENKTKLNNNKLLHVTRDSLLSINSEWTEFNGIRNLLILLVAILILQLFLDISLNYGFLPTFQLILNWILNSFSQAKECLIVLLFSNLTIFIVYFMELFLDCHWKSNIIFVTIHRNCENHWISNIFATIHRNCVIIYLSVLILHITLPAIFLFNGNDNKYFVLIVFICLNTETMKLFSYIHLNYCCRHILAERLEKSKMNVNDEKPILEDEMLKDEMSKDKLANEFDKDNRQNIASKNEVNTVLSSFLLPISDNQLALYPNNLTISNLYYFILSPTLCYELDFPKNPKRRWILIFKHLIELFSLVYTIITLSMFWVNPILKKSGYSLNKLNATQTIQLYLQLCLPEVVIHLLGFYIYFHAFLNLIGELLRFSDRQFYGPLWNSSSIFEYWRFWNSRFNQWAVRHMYKPLLKAGCNKFIAQTTVFLFSDLLHAYAYYIVLKQFLFGGMTIQPLLARITERLIGRGRAGNLFFWSFTILIHVGVILFGYVNF